MSAPLFSNQMRGKVVRGLMWKGGSQFARQLLRIIVAVILARLLSPHDYGIAGMVIVFSALALIFSDLALGAALVQRDELTEEDRSTAFWTSLGAGVFFSVAGILLAGPIADLYGEPQVRWLFVALSFTFVLTSVGTTQAALLSRDLDFRRLELRLMGGALVGAVVGIVLAVRGYGPWAIIGQQVAAAVVSTGLIWFSSPWRPRFVFSRSSLNDLGQFGANVFSSRILFYVNRNADNMLVGRYLGAASLGAYTIAYNLMLAALQPDRVSAAGGAVPGVLAHAERHEAAGRGVARRRSDGRCDLDPGAARADRRRARLRRGRARLEVGVGRAADSDPLLGRAPPVSPGAELGDPRGAEPDAAALALRGDRHRRERDRLRARPPLGARRRRRRLRDLEHDRRAALHADDRRRPRHLDLRFRPGARRG